MAKKKPTLTRALALLHELARHIVDRRDMVGIHGVAQAEAVGEQGRSQQDGLLAEYHERPYPGGQIEDDEQAVDADQRRPQASCAAVENPFDRGGHLGVVASSRRRGCR